MIKIKNPTVEVELKNKRYYIILKQEFISKTKEGVKKIINVLENITKKR